MQLMRVYGALMWSLGKVLNTPELKLDSGITGFLHYLNNSIFESCSGIDLRSFKCLQIIQVTSMFVCRSFNDKPVNESAVGPLGKELFEREQDDLLSDLRDIPKKACDRRVNFFFVFLSMCSLSPN